MNNKKELIILLVVIISIIIITIGGIAFAYFAANKTTSNLNLDVSTTNNMYTFETESSDNINFNLSFNDMSGANTSTRAVKSTKTNINVTLSNPEDGVMTKCTYDIVWVWDSEDKYTTPDVVLPYYDEISKKRYYNEFSIQLDADSETDLSKFEQGEDHKKIILKKSASIISIEKETKIINHEITTKIYNLPVDQTNLFNKNFAAHIEIENVNCQMEWMHSIFENCPGENDLTSCIKSLDAKEETEFADGDGMLYHHTTELENSAEDGGYRYAGNQPNNYICFGAGSEKYNRGEAYECPNTNKYRIIGLFPFDDENNQLISSENPSKYLLKIIKAEYVNENELGINKTGTVSSNKTYGMSKRIEADASKLDGFHWNDNIDLIPINTWENGSLYTALNDEVSGYLNFLYGSNETNKNIWENKLEKVKWNVGGWNKYSTPNEMYEGEMTDSGYFENNNYLDSVKQGSGTKIISKVGLMYVYDYGFAASKDVWTRGLGHGGYESDINRQNNWIINGVYEWTISRASSTSTEADDISSAGYVNANAPVRTYSGGVRPALYLNSNVIITKDENATGSRDHPYRVDI